MKKMYLAGMFLCLGLLAFGPAFSTTYYSKGNLAQNLVTSWNSDRDGTSGTTPANFTTSGDVFIVQGIGGGAGAPHTMLSTSTLTFGANVKLQIENGATLQASNTMTMNATGTFQVDNGGKYINNHTNSHPLQGTVSLAPNSTYEIQASTSSMLAAGANMTFGNLVINTSGTTNINANGGINTIQGNLTIIGTGTGSFAFGAGGGYTTTVNGTVEVQNGSLRTNSTTVAASQVLNIGGNVLLKGGIFQVAGGATTSPATVTVNITGDVIVTNGTFNGSGNSGAVATTTINGSVSVSSGIFAVSNSTGIGTVHILQNVLVTGGTFTIINGTTTGGTFVLTVDGNVTISGGVFGSTSGPAYNIAIGGDLNLEAGGTYQWASGATGTGSRLTTLSLGGNFNMTGGNFDGSSSLGNGAATLRFTGVGKTYTQSAGTISSKLFTVVASGASLTWNSPYAIPVGKSLNVAGTANFNGQSITFKSDATSTARLDAVTGTILGDNNVTVERFIGSASPKRAWRLLTAPLRSTTADVSVYDAWQLGGAIGTTGKGTLITGPNHSGNDGLDAVSGHSLKTLVANNMVGVDNTINTPLFTNAATAANKSYFLFVRGDRSLPDLTYVSQTTLSATGSLQVGDQVFAASPVASDFTLVGNPYPSPVNFAQLTKNNVVNRFYAWDPTINQVGGFITVDDVTNSGTYAITGGTTSQTQHVQSGQAVFIQTAADGAANLTFTEASKSTSTVSSVFRINDGSDESISASLFLLNSDNSLTVADAVLARYNMSFSNMVDVYDAPKMTNINENLAIARNGKLLSIERRSLVDNADTLFLNLTKTTARAYRFVIEPNSFNAPLLVAYLEDAYLHTSTPISLSAPTAVDFSITADPLSAAADRFRIVFKTSGALPVNYTAVKAYQQNAGIQVDWKVATETNLRGYEVEKSNDGRNFTAAATVAARANNNSAVSYSWFDAAPVNGVNYYRVKAIDNSGAAKYSQVVNVRIGAGKSEIVLYPNPVIGNTLSLQFTNETKGTYTLNLYNNIGQVVFSKTIVHNGGSATQTISLGNAVSKGVYQLQLSNGEVKLNQQVICN